MDARRGRGWIGLALALTLDWVGDAGGESSVRCKVAMADVVRLSVR